MYGLTYGSNSHSKPSMEDGILDEDVGRVSFEGYIVVPIDDGPIPKCNVIREEGIYSVSIARRGLGYELDCKEKIKTMTYRARRSTIDIYPIQ